MITASRHSSFQIIYDTIGENNEIDIKKKISRKIRIYFIKNEKNSLKKIYYPEAKTKYYIIYNNFTLHRVV